MGLFRDRRDAGRQLAVAVQPFRAEHPIVLGLPRGGVPVAAEVATALDAPMDVIVIRKLGLPSHPELGMGAIGEDGVRVLNEEVLRDVRVPPSAVAAVESKERVELERRARRFRGSRPMIPLSGRTVIIVDDGIATGGTARAALHVARAHGAHRIVLAVPVAAPDTIRDLATEADDIVCLATPRGFFGVGQWYDDFGQTTDDEVVELLAAHARRATAPRAEPSTTPCDEEVELVLDDVTVAGRLTVPERATGIVVFAHGSGSSRHSPRNRAVARVLNETGFATLLFDLLTEAEEQDRENVFDIELLARRLDGGTRWIGGHATLRDLPVGYFGASTGAGAALWAAAGRDNPVRAVVSRGGRADLAGTRLSQVRAPTLLIVGSRDETVLELNRQAARLLLCEHSLAVVPGATHLFEEPGALDRVAALACAWFARHLRSVDAPAGRARARL